MKRYLLLVVAAALLFWPLSTEAAVKPKDIITAINKVRVKNHLPIVRRDYRLELAARARSRQIVNNANIAHARPLSSTWRMVRQTGYQFRASGELLASDYTTADAMVKAWLKSPAHRKIILNRNLRDIGTSVLRAPPGVSFTYAAVALLGQKSGI